MSLSSIVRDVSYFESYGDLNVQRLMLLDEPRTSIYKKAIQSNSIKDKIVVDVGSGTGVLALFAAMEGARRVFAIEASVTLCSVIRQLAIANKLDSKIVVVNSRVENIPNIDALWRYPTIEEEQQKGTGRTEEQESREVESSGDNSDQQSGHERVDVLVSEWMGFYLLHEGMLSSVLYARDTFLKSQVDGGIMLPDKASIYLTIGSLPEIWNSKIGWTSKPFYELDVSSLAPSLLQIDQSAPIIEVLPPSAVSVASIERVCTIDLWTVHDDDLQSISCQVSPVLHSPHLQSNSHQEPSHPTQLHGFLLWFDVEFPTNQSTTSHQSSTLPTPITQSSSSTQSSTTISAPNQRLPQPDSSSSTPSSLNNSKLIFDTSPLSSPTHWKQCVLLFDQPMDIIPNMRIHCQTKLQRIEQRSYEINVEVVDVEPID